MIGLSSKQKSFTRKVLIFLILLIISVGWGCGLNFEMGQSLQETVDDLSDVGSEYDMMYEMLLDTPVPVREQDHTPQDVQQVQVAQEQQDAAATHEQEVAGDNPGLVDQILEKFDLVAPGDCQFIPTVPVYVTEAQIVRIDSVHIANLAVQGLFIVIQVDNMDMGGVHMKRESTYFV